MTPSDVNPKPLHEQLNSNSYAAERFEQPAAGARNVIAAADEATEKQEIAFLPNEDIHRDTSAIGNEALASLENEALREADVGSITTSASRELGLPQALGERGSQVCCGFPVALLSVLWTASSAQVSEHPWC